MFVLYRSSCITCSMYGLSHYNVCALQVELFLHVVCFDWVTIMFVLYRSSCTTCSMYGLSHYNVCTLQVELYYM